MANTIKMLLWLHKSKTNQDGKAPLILRLSFQTQRSEKSTGYYLNPKDRNSARQRSRGNSNESIEINKRIDDLVTKLSVLARRDDNDKNVYLPLIISQLFATSVEEPMLLKYMREHNQKLKERVGKDFALSTYEKYVFTYNKLEAFVDTTFKRKDILLRELETKFIMDFDHYLRVNDLNQHNTAVKYCVNLKRVLNVAVMEGLLEKSTLNKYKTVYKDTPQIYLSEAEVQAIEFTGLKKSSHKLVRDLFIFQCYTGLAFTDMAKLKKVDISIDNKGNKWIIKARQKTGITSTIPLLPRALEIIDDYSKRFDSEYLLPAYSIQKYNQYIGEVGTLASLSKKLSSHVGRRTFGNIALARGISINVISKILGHSSILITQRIYAITTQNIISKEIDKW